MAPKRDRKNAKVFGVCSGLAKEYGWDVFLVRLLAVILMILTGFVPLIVLYIILAIIMD